MEKVELHRLTKLPILKGTKLYFEYTPTGKPRIYIKPAFDEYPNAIAGESITQFCINVEKDSIERYVVKNYNGVG